jgi:uncharacterized protein (DUF1015 family)
VIGPATLPRLLGASPWNVARLILPKASDDAAALLRDWLAAGTLAVDDAPSLYVYEQRGDGWTQRGLIGLVAVGTDSVLPHEGVMRGPVAGRRELMKAAQANFEPILLVYNGAGGDASRLSDAVADAAADGTVLLATGVTGDGVAEERIGHRLWAVTDAAVQSAISADLAARTALIADGHHRYAAYRELKAEMHDAGAGPGPWDYGLAFLVDADAYPLRLGAIHRVLPRLYPAQAARLAGAAFSVTEVPPAEGERRLLAAGESGTAFLLAGGGRSWLLTNPDPGQAAAAMPAQASPRWQALDASVMQELLLATLWSIKDNEADVLISHDAAEAVAMADDTGGTAVICNPMPLAAVMDIAAHGEKVPRKSTSFGPKPRTGLVLRTFEAERPGQ